MSKRKSISTLREEIQNHPADCDCGRCCFIKKKDAEFDAIHGAKSKTLLPATTKRKKSKSPAQPVVKNSALLRTTWCTHCTTQLMRERNVVIRHLREKHQMSLDNEAMITAVLNNKVAGAASPDNLVSPQPAPTVSIAPKQPAQKTGSKDDVKKLAPIATVLRNSELCSCVDVPRLFISPVFTNALNFAASHYENQGDLTFLSTLLEWFNDTKWYKPLLLWMCFRCGLRPACSKNQSSVVLKKDSSKPAVSYVSLTEYLTRDREGTMHDVLVKLDDYKPQNTHKKIDMLDARWVMYPGSFGG